MSSLAQIEARLFEGQRLIKTMDCDAATGTTWSFEDGRTARADLCERLVVAGVIQPMADGLFDDIAQTWTLAPYDADLGRLVTERHGPGWAVVKRRTKKLREQHETLILPGEYAATEREWKARHALAEPRLAA